MKIILLTSGDPDCLTLMAVLQGADIASNITSSAGSVTLQNRSSNFQTQITSKHFQYRAKIYASFVLYGYVFTPQNSYNQTRIRPLIGLQ